LLRLEQARQIQQSDGNLVDVHRHDVRFHLFPAQARNRGHHVDGELVIDTDRIALVVGEYVTFGG
jgi:hypothetical protein